MSTRLQVVARHRDVVISGLDFAMVILPDHIILSLQSELKSYEPNRVDQEIQNHNVTFIKNHVT